MEQNVEQMLGISQYSQHTMYKPWQSSFTANELYSDLGAVFPAMLFPLSSAWKMLTPNVLKLKLVSNPMQGLLEHKVLALTLKVCDSLSLEGIKHGDI